MERKSIQKVVVFSWYLFHNKRMIASMLQGMRKDTFRLQVRVINVFHFISVANTALATSKNARQKELHIGYSQLDGIRY